MQTDTQYNLIELYGKLFEEERYQDNLRWKRFINITTVEGAMLLGLTTKLGVSSPLNWILYLAGTIIILIISCIALKDDLDKEDIKCKRIAIEELLRNSGIFPKHEECLPKLSKLLTYIKKYFNILNLNVGNMTIIIFAFINLFNVCFFIVVSIYGW